jgi:hypothetical protein
MNETIMMILGIVAGIIVLMFAISLIALKIIKKKHEKNRYNSLPSGGTDGSEYGEMLVQKYRNQRIEGEL